MGEALHIPAEDVLPASTGVIGQPMVIDPFARGIPAAAAKLAATAQGSTDAATAIMTTDTHKKEYAIQFELGGKTCTVGAIGKGSGMIAPNMATMLAFYTTDAAVFPALLEKALKTVVPGTYNQMSVDLDTSTNDTLIIMASGLAGNPEICEENADYDAFVAALTAIAEHMCAEHAGDGEGATHLITCEVTHAPDLKTARAVSRSVGLCGMDGQMLRCTELDPALGHVGEIIHVDSTLISTLLDGGYIPVIATVGMDDLGQAYNVNADTAAAQIAIALKAEKLVSMTDIAGLLRDKDDETTLIPEVEVSEIEGYKAAGIIAGGMIPKIGGMADAIYQGVHEAVIIDGRVPHSILLELFSNRGSGTRFYRRSHQE